MQMGTRKILCVDDEKQIRELFKKILESHGYFVSTASNGTEAVREVHEDSELALVFMDLNMPGMDGLTAIEEIRKTHQVPITVITGYGYPEDKERCKTLNCDYMSKPVNIRDLVSKAEQYAPLR